MSIIENPLVLGLVVVGLTWLIRKFNWNSEGVKALWLTMGISLVIAVLDAIFGTAIVPLPAWPGWASPGSVLEFVGGVLGGIVANAGVIFGSAQLIYQALRREIVNGSALVKSL